MVGLAGACVTVEPGPSCRFLGSPHNSSLTKYVAENSKTGLFLSGSFQSSCEDKVGTGENKLHAKQLVLTGCGRLIQGKMLMSYLSPANTACETMTTQRDAQIGQRWKVILNRVLNIAIAVVPEAILDE